MIVAYTDAAALAAKAATTTIPIVFLSGDDPVKLGLVESLARPGENITGVSWFGVDLVPKQLSLLHELVPNAAVIALLVDPNVPDATSRVSEVQAAARTIGLQLVVLNARTASDIDVAFASLVRERAGALVVGAGGFLVGRRNQIIALAEAMRFRRFMDFASTPSTAAWSVTATTSQTLFIELASIPGEFSRAISRLIYRSSARPNSS